jgi:hypothetical protein
MAYLAFGLGLEKVGESQKQIFVVFNQTFNSSKNA